MRHCTAVWATKRDPIKEEKSKKEEDRRKKKKRRKKERKRRKETGRVLCPPGVQAVERQHGTHDHRNDSHHTVVREHTQEPRLNPRSTSLRKSSLSEELRSTEKPPDPAVREHCVST